MNRTVHLKKLKLKCKQHGIVPTRFVLVVSISNQTVSIFDRVATVCDCGPNYCRSISSAVTGSRDRLIKKVRCSTSRFGVGQAEGSNRTPLEIGRAHV